MPNPPDHFISCDWGTTNFRLHVVITATGRVVAQHATEQGIRSTYQAFRESGQDDQFAYFADYLTRQLDSLPPEHRRHTVVASGMTSANIGLRELPYAGLPMDAAGISLVTEWLSLPGNQKLLLISGVAAADDIMRGEEVQALGLTLLMEPYGNGTLILPGTHSKHLRYIAGSFPSFTTYLTGELFDILSRRSILANSVAPGPYEPDGIAAFTEGVELGIAGRLSSSLFSIRVRDVLGKRPLAENYYLLSGLLIGEELRELPREEMIYLAAPDPILTLYRTALESILPPDRLICFDGTQLERALLSGQTKLLLRHA